MTQSPQDVTTAPARRDGRTLLIDDAARVMGVSRRTVYYRIREGQLATVKTINGSTRIVVPSVETLMAVGQRKNASTRPTGAGDSG